MYLFLVFSLPIAFALLVLDCYPPQERTAARKPFSRGLAACIPIWLVARLLGAIVPQDQGSFLLAFHEWADRYLPYSVLPALGYLVFYKPDEKLEVGEARRRLTSFYAGALAPIGLCETFRLWGSPDFYGLFVLPLFLAAICLAMPKLAAAIHGSYGLEMAKYIGALVGTGLLASLCPWLILVSLWPLALLLAAALCAGAYFYAYPELEAHTPVYSID
jgi:hypothetical protein